MLYLAFDMVQLTAMLYLCGGLQNPFAAMILIYVTIAAAILSRTGVRMMALAAFACLTFLAFEHQPLPWRDGGLLLDRLYSCGVWAALTIACAFISFYVSNLVREARQMSEALAATTEALVREQKISAVGGLAAATAHQLATPLNTITLIAHDLLDDIKPGHALRGDAELLLQQSMACRDALAGLSAKAKSLSAQDAVLSRLPLSAFVELAVDQAKSSRSGIDIDVRFNADQDPMVWLRPEILHALGNVLQNAVHHAASRVELESSLDSDKIYLSILDNGPGFPVDLLPDLGEPYIQRRGDYAGMGLGLFIAKTMLQNLGAIIQFSNHPDGGAEVVLEIPRAAFAARGSTSTDAVAA